MGLHAISTLDLVIKTHNCADNCHLGNVTSTRSHISTYRQCQVFELLFPHVILWPQVSEFRHGLLIPLLFVPKDKSSARTCPFWVRDNDSSGCHPGLAACSGPGLVQQGKHFRVPQRPPGVCESLLFVGYTRHASVHSADT